jgi:hypothetical protein
MPRYAITIDGEPHGHLDLDQRPKKGGRFTIFIEGQSIEVKVIGGGRLKLDLVVDPPWSNSGWSRSKYR